jgi:hypothetical protein
VGLLGRISALPLWPAAWRAGAGLGGLRRRRRLRRRAGTAALAASLVFALAARLAPARTSDARLRSAAAGIAAGAARLTQEEIVAAVREKAIECGVPEAAAPGAVAASRASSGGAGVCAVRLKYSKRVDFYGVTSVRLDTDAEIVRLFAARYAEGGRAGPARRQ